MRRLFAAFPVLCLLLAGLIAGLTASPASARLVLEAGSPTVKAWPVARLLPDPQGTLRLDEAMAARERFSPADPDRASLGLREGAVWLHLPLRVDPVSNGQWVLDINYPVLNRVEVYLTRNEQVLQAVALGNQLPFADRPLNGRTLAVPLTLQPGGDHDLWLRVQSAGALVLPLTLSQPAAHQRAALAEQMLQGLLGGLALCLLVYSLAQWVTLRDTLFLKYALLVTGSGMFSVFQFGLGNQFLWTDLFWLERHAAGLFSLMATAGSFLFIEHALRAPDSSRAFRWLMQGGAVLSALIGLAYASGALDGRAIAGIVSVLGLMPALLGLPGATRRALRGDAIGGCFLLAWLIYFVATAIIIGVIQGVMPVNFWTLHAFQFGATLDMLLFMRVLGLRTHAEQLAAQRMARERDDMLSLAHTDPLTGLPNRRHLNNALHGALAQCGGRRLVAVYALDLDGFKPVNDRYGHDVGDQLLAAVAQRLRAHTRSNDTVARVGGDEFVVMARELPDDAAAQELGRKLIEAFDLPFDVAGTVVQVGLTVGYALAPPDGTEGPALLKRADMAMYEGKQAGKHCLRRLAAD